MRACKSAFACDNAVVRSSTLSLASCGNGRRLRVRNVFGLSAQLAANPLQRLRGRVHVIVVLPARKRAELVQRGAAKADLRGAVLAPVRA